MSKDIASADADTGARQADSRQAATARSAKGGAPAESPPTTGTSAPHDVEEPRPWLTDEDAKGWRTVYRGTGRRRPPPLITVVVELDAAQSTWVRQQATAGGLGYDEYVKGLIDAARAAPA